MSRSLLAKLLVVLVGLVLVPATTARAAVETEPQDPCATVGTDLEDKLKEIKSGLLVESPDRPSLSDQLRDTKAVAERAQSDGCLPELSLRDEVLGCEARTEDLLGGLLGALGAVVAGALDGALSLVDQLMKTVTGLLGGGCLPKPPVPGTP